MRIGDNMEKPCCEAEARGKEKRKKEKPEPEEEPKKENCSE